MSIKKCIVGCWIFTALFLGMQVAAMADDSRIEQVYINLPEVTVYGENMPDGVQNVYLGEKKLEQSAFTDFSQSGQPIYYYILLDISNSMPESYFDSVKSSVLAFEKKLSEQDRMVLYTFGENVTLQLDEEHDRGLTETVLSGIENTDNRTSLFAAVSQAAMRTDRVLPETCQRKVMVVISDGEDFTVGGTGQAEAMAELEKRGIPVYALGIQDTARVNINSLGEFARSTGGQLQLFGEADSGEILVNLDRKLRSFDVMTFRAEDNMVSNEMELFSLTDANNQSWSKEVFVSRYIPDLDAPYMESLKKIEKGQIEIQFSETVVGVNDAANYVVTRIADSDGNDVTVENQIVTVTGITADKERSNVMYLHFQDDILPGQYQVSCSNITDMSMEKNSISNALVFSVEEPPFSEKMMQFVKDWFWIPLVGIVAILIGVIVGLFQKIKKNRGVVYVDGKPMMASAVEMHKHIAIQEEEGKKFYVRVSVKGRKPEEMTLNINSSFIVGRANICNLYFDDSRMSRQHFALEWDGKDFYVTDLDTTNGTRVNDVKISKRRRLQQNDKISAGSVEMTIRW